MASNEPERRRTAVVLAAGANTRLNPVVPPGLKPLMLVNGKPLVSHAVHHAFSHWYASQCIIVCSPSNVDHITKVVTSFRSDIDFVVQPSPDGILDAIYRGARVAQHPRVVLLCADNTFEPENCIEPGHLNKDCIAVRELGVQEANRFTRLERFQQEHLGGKSGYKLRAPGDNAASRMCWIGPVCLDRDKVVQQVRHSTRVEDLIMACSNDGTTLNIIQMECEDFGIPEMLDAVKL